MQQIECLNDLLKSYDVIFCDVWGVIHNGESVYQSAVEALVNARANGLKVICVTNSPRLNDCVRRQLGQLDVNPQAWDDIVTSGDVTRKLISSYSPYIYHIGSSVDHSIFNDLDISLVDANEAKSIVCTGLFDNMYDLKDYIPLFEKVIKDDLPFICANPDLVVDYRGSIMLCAGSLAKIYQQMGGRTFFAGKPFYPIYQLAQQKAEKLIGKVKKSRILAIGDGLLTDVKGANDQNIDSLYITGGIHRDLSEKELLQLNQDYRIKIDNFMTRLA